MRSWVRPRIKLVFFVSIPVWSLGSNLELFHQFIVTLIVLPGQLSTQNGFKDWWHGIFVTLQILLYSAFQLLAADILNTNGAAIILGIGQVWRIGLGGVEPESGLTESGEFDRRTVRVRVLKKIASIQRHPVHAHHDHGRRDTTRVASLHFTFLIRLLGLLWVCGIKAQPKRIRWSRMSYADMPFLWQKIMWIHHIIYRGGQKTDVPVPTQILLFCFGFLRLESIRRLLSVNHMLPRVSFPIFFTLSSFNFTLLVLILFNPMKWIF